MTIAIRTPIREGEDSHLELWNACGSRLSNQNSLTSKMCDPDVPLMTSSEDEPVWTSEDEESEETESEFVLALRMDGAMKSPDGVVVRKSTKYREADGWMMLKSGRWSRWPARHCTGEGQPAASSGLATVSQNSVASSFDGQRTAFGFANPRILQDGFDFWRKRTCC